MKKVLSIVLILILILSIVPFQIISSATVSSTSSTSNNLMLVSNTGKILNDISKLGENETTPYIAQLTGKVVRVDQPYNAKYGMVTVTIIVDEMHIRCYGMKGINADKVKAGDTITVRGVIKNFVFDEYDKDGTIEFCWNAESQTEVTLIQLISASHPTDISLVDVPKVGTAYKFGFYNKDLGVNCFATGGTTGGIYVETTSSPAVAADVFLEKAGSGYYIYTIHAGKKKYLDMVFSKEKNRPVARYRSTPTSVFTYNTDRKTLTSKFLLFDDFLGVEFEAEFAFGNFAANTNIATPYFSETAIDDYECRFYQYDGHHFEWVIDKYADCTTDTIMHEKCTRCGEINNVNTKVTSTGHFYDNSCDTDCNVCGAEREATHTYKKYKTTDATTSKNGKKYYECSVCGATKTSTIYKVSKVYLSTEEYTYNGKTKKPSVKVYDSKGKKLDYGEDYTYKRPSSSKKVGKYKIKITFKGDYTGTKTLYYTINPKGTKVSSVTAAKKSLKVKIVKQSTQTTGYQIQYSTSSKFKSAKTKTISSYKTTSYTIKSLSAKKYYYVRVRTYKTVDGKKYYSDWSKSVKKKTK